MKNVIILLSVVISLSSCFKEEDKIKDLSIGSSSMKIGEDYGNQIFFNLSNQEIVSQNKWSIWNLAFYAQEDDFYIKLNHPANMKAYKTSLNFDAISGFDSNWESDVDFGNGDRDQIALDFKIDFQSNDTTFYEEEAYVIMLGSDATGVEIGHKKIQLLYTYLSFYAIKYSNIDGSEEVVDFIEKNNTLNFVYYTFNKGGEIVEVEPDKTTWDLLFTRTTDMAIGGTDTIFDYSVVSVLLNPFSSQAYIERDLKYEDQNLSNLDQNKFVSDVNEIGYYWKFYNLELSQYSIIPNKFYLIKDINNYFYKMKFVSFYDPDTNSKGTISFEYELL